MSNNNIVILDLSKPRKVIINKYNNIIFNLKMKGYKSLITADKILPTLAISIVVFMLISQTTVYANELIENLSNTEVIQIFTRHMQDLNYTDEYINKLLNTYDIDTMKNILNESINVKNKIKETTPLVEFLELEYKGLEIATKYIVSDIEKTAHLISSINPFMRLFK